MNKKVLGIAVALMFVAMMIAPVMAKGPANALDKNPNLVKDEGTYVILDIQTPGGLISRWVEERHGIVKPADKFYSPTELDAGDNWLGFLLSPIYRGKWAHLDKGEYIATDLSAPPWEWEFYGYLGMRATMGLPEPDVPEEGVYVWQAK